MPKFRDRECATCGSILKNTASRAEICLGCQKKQKKERDAANEVAQLHEWQYIVISGPWLDKFNHRCYKVKTPCNHEWEAPFNNLKKQILNAQAKGLRPACGVCGPQHRMKTALDGFMDKYARDYDLNEYNDYMRKVRGLSNVNYKRFKNVINPNNLPRGHHEYHLDHIVPIIECFKRGLPAEEAARPDNLQMLHCKENLAKGGA